MVNAVGVLPSPAGCESISGLQHKRNFDLSTRHVAQARGFIDDLIHGDEHEFAHPQLDDGTQAGDGGAYSDPNFRRFRNRRQADAIAPEQL